MHAGETYELFPKALGVLPAHASTKVALGTDVVRISEGILVCFIGLALTARGRSGVDDANFVTAFRMRDYHEAPSHALTDKEPPFLTN